MAKFQSYARPEGFRPIEAPDETRKYLAQGQQALQAMQRAMDFDIDNRNKYLTAMQNMQQIEASNRDLVFQRDTRNRQTVQDQVQNNYLETIRQAERQGQQELTNLKNLSAFSQTAAEALGKFNEKREQGIKLAVQQSMFNLGLDLKGWIEFRKIDRNLTDQALRENQFIKGLLEQGKSIQDVRYLMKHSNARYYTDSRYLAEQAGGIGYQEWFNSNSDKKYKVGEGGEVSYNEALATNNLESQELVIKQIRAEYMAVLREAGISVEMQAAHVYPAMHSFEQNLQKTSNAQFRKEGYDRAKNDINLALEQGFASGGAAFGAEYIKNTPAGPQRSAAKSTIFDHFEAGLDGPNPLYYMELYQGFLKQPFDDQTTIGEAYKFDPRAIALSRKILATRDRLVSETALKRKELQIEYDRDAKALAEILLNNPDGFTAADGEAAQERLQELYKDKEGFIPGTRSDIIDNLIKNQSVNAVYISKTEEQLQALYDSGHLTKERLKLLGLPKSLEDKWMKVAEDNSEERKANQNFKFELESLSIKAQSPPQVAAKVVGGKYHPSVSLMEQQLHSMFLKTYTKLKAGGDPDAVANALTYTNTWFDNQVKNPKFFDSEGGYAQFTKRLITESGKVAAIRMQQVETNIKNLGRNALDTPGAIYNKAELLKLEQDMQSPRFTMDPRATLVASKMGSSIDPFTVINRQRKAAGLPIIGLPTSRTTFNNTVDPELKRKLDAYQTPQLSTRAMISTRTFNDSLIPKGYGPLVTAASSKHGVPAHIVAAVIEKESTWNSNAVSPKGARGLMQLMPQWHKASMDPQANVDEGTAYLNQMYRRYGNWDKALAAYNMGPTQYDEYTAQGRQLPAETRKYVKDVNILMGKYGDVSRLQSRSTMRQSMSRYGSVSFERPSSVVFETASGQPGVDLYFASKQFPAVLDGVVKDVSREPGYGNYVVIESTDPATGQKVDVLYAHLADGLAIRPGQQINAGDIIGTQGGTGNVRSRDGTIASIDFLAPAPRGSKSMKPYAGFDNLRRYVVSQLQR